MDTLHKGDNDDDDDDDNNMYEHQLTPGYGRKPRGTFVTIRRQNTQAAHRMFRTSNHCTRCQWSLHNHGC